MKYRSKVFSNGCIAVDSLISIDGFHPGARARIQTHCHEDHLLGFDSSKSQMVYLSEESRKILIAERNADLAFRSNIIAIPDSGVEIANYKIRGLSSGHIRGGIMPLICTPDGYTVLYSSDFNVPNEGIRARGCVDELIIDATYGDPQLQRNYSEDVVWDSFLEVLHDRAAIGSVVIVGYKGRLHSAMAACHGMKNKQIVVGRKTSKTIREFGVDCHSWITPSRNMAEVLDCAREGRLLGFFQMHESREYMNIPARTRIALSAYMVGKQVPVVSTGGDNFRIAITDHADFSGTIKLIEDVNPKRVLVDGSRGGHASVLAQYVSNELKIQASAEMHLSDPR